MQRIGNYPIVRKLGEGGMGRVFLVKDEVDGSYWAAKQFKGDRSKPLFIQRFRREYRALEALNHPAIVRVRNMDYTVDPMFFLMEYVDGRPLRQVLKQNRDFGPEWINQVLTWLRYLCDPLEYIHNKRMVHRDLKPGNIMILGPESDPPLKLLDFGIIHWMHSDIVTTTSPTFLGSLRYMAPEQMNSTVADLRSDLYSLGVIMYEAITGRPPFSVDNPILLVSLHQTAEPPPPNQYNVHITESLQSLMMALLAKRPDDRPSSACEVGDWIQRILDGSEFTRPDPRCSVFMTGLLFTPDLCGREVELRSMVDGYDKCKKGETVAVTIHGSTGVGKSRLITQFQRMPDLAQQIICFGEFQKDAPLHNGILYALKRGRISAKKRQLLQPFSNRQKYDELFESIDETIAELEGNLKGNTGQPLSLKEVAAQILTILYKLADKDPLLIVLDDIHLAKPGDLLLLRHLVQLYSLGASGSSAQGFMILLGFRDEPELITFALADFLEWLDGREVRSDQQLNGLNKIAVNRMVTSLLGGAPAPALASAVYEESRGNPLHIIEILRELIENQPDPMWNQVGSDESTHAIPGKQRITQIMGRRVDRFEDNVKEVVQAGAILGKSFRADELEEVCHIDEDMFLDQVDQLLRQRIFEEDMFHGGTYRFSHLKLQEAVYKKIPDDEKRVLHARALNVLNDLHQENIGRVAERMIRHANYCGERRKEVDLRIHASEYSDSLGDQIDARDHLLEAKKLFNKTDVPKDERVEQLLKIDVQLGSLLRRTGDVSQAEALLLDVQKLAQEQSDLLNTAHAHKQLGSLWGSQGKIKEATKSLENAKAIYEDLKVDEEMIDCLINIGASYNHANEFQSSLTYLRMAMEKSQLIGDNRRLTMALINIGLNYASRFKGEKALPYLNRARQLSEEQKYRRLKAFALMGIASAYLSPELLEEHALDVIDLTDQVIEIVKKTGDTNILMDCLYKRSIASHHRGLPVVSDLDRVHELALKLGQLGFAEEVEHYRDTIRTSRGRSNDDDDGE